MEKTALLRQRRTTLRTVKLPTETLLIGLFGSSVVTGLIMLFFFNRPHFVNTLARLLPYRTPDSNGM